MIDSLLNSVTGFVSDGISALQDTIVDSILSAINTAIGYFLYWVDVSECAILHLVYEFFGIFAGISRVAYKGEQDYLINVFFSHNSINNIYWAMAMIGIVMAVGFTILAVIKKMFDMEDQEKRSMGGILTSLIKAVAIIAAMNFIIVAALNFTNILMQRVNYAFNNAESLDDPDIIVYSSDQYVYMNEIMETIGTYAMNPSYSSRYNINSCFNSIRPSLKLLQSTGMFDIYYSTSRIVTVNGKDTEVEIDTWQSVLQDIVRSTSLDSDVAIDVYHDALNKAILHAMDCLRNNSSFYPLQYYEERYNGVENADLDVVIFMTGTGSAAKNDAYNEYNVSLTDGLRGAYVYGEKSIYRMADVTGDFNIGLVGGISHLLIIVLCILLIKELIVISLAAVVRIFSMLLLYIIAPPIVSTMPLDNGDKFKQWTVAFVIQAFSLFGTVIAMRLLILFIPIILSSDLVLLENPVLNLAAKAFLIYGGTVAASKASGMVTGILSGNAGWQAVQAGDVRGEANDFMNRTGLSGLSTAGVGAGAFAANTAWGAAKLAGKGAAAVGKAAWGAMTGGSSDSGPSGGDGSSGGGSSGGGGVLPSGGGGGTSAAGADTGVAGSGPNGGPGDIPPVGGNNTGTADSGNIPGNSSSADTGGNDVLPGNQTGTGSTADSLPGNSNANSQGQNDQNLKNLFGEKGYQQIKNDRNLKNLFGEQGFRQIQAQRRASSNLPGAGNIGSGVRGGTGTTQSTGSSSQGVTGSGTTQSTGSFPQGVTGSGSSQSSNSVPRGVSGSSGTNPVNPLGSMGGIGGQTDSIPSGSGVSSNPSGSQSPNYSNLNNSSTVSQPGTNPLGGLNGSGGDIPSGKSGLNGF